MTTSMRTSLMLMFMIFTLYSGSLLGTDLSGYINTDSTLSVTGSPYDLVGDLYVRNGAVLTIESGVTINFMSGSYQIFVGYSAASPGTMHADNVQFNGYNASTGDYIIYRYGSSGSLTSCTFRDIYVSISESAPAISQCTADNAYLTLTDASPTIQNIAFSNTTYGLEFVNECSPALSNISFTNVTNPGINVRGTVNSDWTLNNYGLPYYLSNNVTVNSGATLTIASGDTIYFISGSYRILTGSNTSSLGTLNADNVHFIGYAASAGDYIQFNYGSPGNLTNCTFRDIYLNIIQSAPFIDQCSGENFYISMTEASPTIQNVTFNNATYGLEFINENSPTLGTITFNSVTNPGINLRGTVDSDWTLNNYGLPYFLSNDLTVNNNATLTIAPGNMITTLSTSYELIAGSSASSPGTVNAQNVTFAGNPGDSYDDELNFQYGSTGTLDGCTFNGMFVRLSSSSPTVQNCTFSNVNYPITFIDESSPALSNIICTESVGYAGIQFSGTVDSDWTLPKYTMPYYLTGDLSVRSGATLTITSEDSIFFQSGSYQILVGYNATSSGTLLADNVHFIGFPTSTSDNVTIQFGSSGSVTNCTFKDIYLNISASAPAITQCSGDNFYISMTEATPDIRDIMFNNSAFGLEFVNENTPALSNIQFNNVTNPGINLRGTIDSDWTLNNYGLPYFLSNDLTVNNNATLTIAPANTITTLSSSYELIAGSSASSSGTINAHNVTFNGHFADSYDDEINIQYGSTGTLDECTFNSMYVRLSSSSPTISNCTFSDLNYPILFVDECSPVLTDIICTETVDYTGIQFSGTVDSEWTLPNYGLPYFLTNDLNVHSGATLTIASGDTIYFQSNSYEINVGSSTTSIGTLNADSVCFASADNTDDEIYFRYGSSGILSNCAFETIRLYMDNSSPAIQSSRLFHSTTAIYLINDAAPLLTSNDFFNNTSALQNQSTILVDATNNFWGHDSGPQHPDNAAGLGETITGNVNISPFSTSPHNGVADFEVIGGPLDFPGIAVGMYSDLSIDVTSIGNIDALVTDIQTDDPAFSVRTPTEFWMRRKDTVLTTVRFSPSTGQTYSANLIFYTNDTHQPLVSIPLSGTGTPILSVDKSQIDYGIVKVKDYERDRFRIKNIGSTTIRVDSIVSTNDRFSLSLVNRNASFNESIEPEYMGIRKVEDISAIEGISAFYVNAGDSIDIAVTFRPDSRGMETGVIRIHYDATGMESVTVTGEGVADPVNVMISSMNHQSFPFIYMNVAVDTFAAGISSLSQSNFTVTENGIVQTDYFSVTPPGESGGSRLADIIFIMDNSGSLGDEQEQVETNVMKFVNTLSDSGINFALGLCRYGASTNSGNPIFEDNGSLTTDADYFLNVIWQRNTTDGGTEPGYSAIQQSTSGFAFRPGTQKIFIIITDETPAQGTTTMDDALNACVDNSVTLFALTMADLYTTFTTITEVTNGEVYNILSDFDEIFQYITSLISNTYVVQYQSGNPLPDGTRRNVEVVVNYNENSGSDTTSYIPGEAPVIKRTETTLAYHDQAWAQNTEFTIEAEITDAMVPYLQSARLYFRTTGDIAYQYVDMTSQSGDLYRGIIPRSTVTAPGLDYYISSSDGQSTSTDPAIEAVNNPYQIAILPNEAPQISHDPVVYSTISKPVLIEAEIVDNTNSLSSTRLFFRKTGQLVYIDTAMTHVSGDLYQITIPGDFSTKNGIDYFIKATDDFNVSNTSGSYDKPHQIFPEFHLHRAFGDSLEYFSISKHSWQFSNSQNNMWPMDWWQQFDYTDQEYPLSWRYWTESSDFPDWHLFANAFGAEQCYLNEPPGSIIYRPKAVHRWARIKDNWNGSCFGFALSCFMAFDSKTDFLNEFPGIGDYDDLYSLNTSDEQGDACRSAINQLWLYQFGDAQLDHIDINENNTPVTTLNQVKSMLSSEDRNDQILVFFNQNGSGGHAVNPIKVRRDESNPNVEKIVVYDNNRPGNEYEISVNKQTNTWDYERMPNWGGSKGIFLMDPVENYYTNPVLPKSVPDQSRYISHSANHYIKFFNSPGCEIDIRNDPGDVIGYQDSVAIDHFADGIPIIPITGNPHRPIGYYIPDQRYQITLSQYADSLSRFSVFTDSISILAERNDVQDDQSDFYEYHENGLKISNLDPLVKIFQVESIFEDESSDLDILIGNYQMNQNDSSRFEVFSENFLKAINYGDERTYDLKLKAASDSLELTFEHDQITFNANTSHIISPDWFKIDSLPVTVYIDHGSDGSIDDSLKLVNQYTGIQVGKNGTALIPKNYYLSQNYPNPFNNATRIRFGLSKTEQVSIVLYNISGQKVSTLVSKRFIAGNHEIIFDSNHLSSGVYFYQIKAGSLTQTRKMVLLK